MDDERLISKKDVLEAMGISYGQLYRWKRKGLIPESWFIRRSTFTGQETFFPRDKIVERIRRIKDMKGDHALDDLADVISEFATAQLDVALKQLRHLGWIDDDLVESSGISEDDGGMLSLRDALRLAVLKKLKRSAREEEITLASRTLESALPGKGMDLSLLEGKTLHLLRKQLSGGGISAEISAIAIAMDELIVDPEMKKIDSIDLAAMLQQVKLDLANLDNASSQERESGRSDDE